jgi:hypothetical protein
MSAVEPVSMLPTGSIMFIEMADVTMPMAVMVIISQCGPRKGRGEKDGKKKSGSKLFHDQTPSTIFADT